MRSRTRVYDPFRMPSEPSATSTVRHKFFSVQTLTVGGIL